MHALKVHMFDFVNTKTKKFPEVKYREAINVLVTVDLTQLSDTWKSNKHSLWTSLDYVLCKQIPKTR